MKETRSFVSRNELRKQARDWVLRFNSDQPPTEEDIAELRKWVAQSPVHERELRSAEQLWVDADVLQRLAVPRKMSRRSPVPFWVGAALAASLMLAVFGWWGATLTSPNSQGEYVTAIGEHRVIELEDGSQVELDTNSRVRVEYSENARNVFLEQGKAYFSVARAIERPFDVYTAQGRVRAVGTAFSVFIDADRVTVTVDEGRVDLARADPAGKMNPDTAQRGISVGSPEMQTFVSLDAGQQAQFGTDTASLQDLAPAQLKQKHAWRRGMLIFSGEPLETVIHEISRYTAVDIEVVNPALSELAIGGRFRTGELDALLDVLESGFGVEVTYVDRNRIELR